MSFSSLSSTVWKLANFPPTIFLQKFRQINFFFSGDYKPERVFSGEVARLNSYKTQRPPFDVKNPYMAPVVANRNLHSDDSDRYCMHVELGLEESRIRYEAGDHVAIYPTNDQGLVNK